MNMNAVVDMTVVTDEVPAEETELADLAADLVAADLTSAFLAYSFIPLSAISAASAAASIPFSRSAAAAYIRRSRSIRRISSS